MKKSTKIALISIPFIVGLYLIYRQFRKPKAITPADVEEKKKQIEEVKVVPKKIDNPTPNCSYPLKNGLYNCSVVGSLQKALNSYIFKTGDVVLVDIPSDILKVDDDFGPKTQNFLSAVTSDIAINRNSSVITYTWIQVPTEADFNKLTDEIYRIVLEEDRKIAPGVVAPGQQAPCNPLTEICY